MASLYSTIDPRKHSGAQMWKILTIQSSPRRSAIRGMVALFSGQLARLTISCLNAPSDSHLTDKGGC